MKKLLVGTSIALVALGGCANGSEEEPPPEEDQQSDMEESESNNSSQDKESTNEEMNDDKNSSDQSDSSDKNGDTNSDSQTENNDKQSNNEGSQSSDQAGPTMNKSKAEEALKQYKEAYTQISYVLDRDGNPDNDYESKQEAINYLTQYMDEKLASSYINDRMVKRNGEFTILGKGGKLYFAEENPFTLEKVNDTTYHVIQEFDNEFYGHIQGTFTLKYDGDSWIVTDVSRKDLE